MILLTGGAGFIGSHTLIALLESGYEVIVLDSLSNSSEVSLARVENISGKSVPFVQGDICDRACLDKLFANYDIEGVIHLAALKAVGESVEKPLEYLQVNVTGTLTLLEAMKHAGVKRFVFSSSATVYGDPETLPLTEEAMLGKAQNPYAASKQMIETALQTLHDSDPQWSIATLRYFNPVGAHESGLIGEDPRNIPNNLFPYITQVAIGRLEQLSVFGDDYPTPDGTGVRDYIHVMDLAEGHVAAYEYLLTHPKQHQVWNLGSGQGSSVLQVVNAFNQVLGRELPYQIKPRRAGDIAACWADADKAKVELNWQTTRTLEQMVADSWRWQQQNPNGFDG